MSVLAVLVLPLLAAIAENAPPAGAAPSANTAAPQPPRAPTLKDVDAGLAAMQKLAADFPAAVKNPGPDHRGRTVQQDVAEHVFTAAAMQRLTQLRTNLASQYPEGTDPPPPALAPLFQTLGTELCRINLLGSYWTLSSRRDYHRGLIRVLTQSEPDTERQADLAAVEAIDVRAEALRDKAAGLTFNECGTQKMRSWIRYEEIGVIFDYNDLRARIVVRESAAGRLPDGTRSMTSRTRACPPAAPATGRTTPAIRSIPDVKAFYPDETQKNGLEGSVRVAVDLDETGCVTAAGVELTSGSELLDQGGVRMALEMLFAPGEVDGKPAGGRHVVPIRFQIPGLSGEALPAQRQP